MNIRLHLVACGLLSFSFVLTSSSWARERTLANVVPTVSVVPVPSGSNTDTLATKSNESSIASLIAQYAADQRTLGQRFRIPLDPFGQVYRSNMLKSWESKLAAIDFGMQDRNNQIDWLLLDSKIRHDRESFERKAERNSSAKALIPYAEKMMSYCSSKEHGTPLTAEEAATLLEAITTEASDLAKALQKPSKDAEKKDSVSGVPAAVAPIVAIDASALLDLYSRQMQETHRYYEGYDPKYTWWATKPFEGTKQAMANHRKAIREKLAGLDDFDSDKIVGVPIGDEALLKELRYAWIPYSPQELITIGEREMQWCEDRFKEVANELKLNGDWRKALEQVKSLHVEPGDQPRLIRELAWEAIRFLEGNDLISIPEMAATRSGSIGKDE